MESTFKLSPEEVEWMHQSYRSGLQTGTGGNFSRRAADKILIKPSGLSFIECTTDNMAVVDLDGRWPDEGPKPSSEMPTHLSVYRRRDDVLGIFHCHSPWAIAFAEHESELAPAARHVTAKIGTVPVLDTGERSTIQDDEIGLLLSQNPGLKAFLHAKHGIFAFGETLLQARFQAELVVEAIQAVYLTTMMGGGHR